MTDSFLRRMDSDPTIQEEKKRKPWQHIQPPSRPTGYLALAFSTMVIIQSASVVAMWLLLLSYSSLGTCAVEEDQFVRWNG